MRSVILHYAYGAVKKSIHAYFRRSDGQVIEVPLPFPMNSNEEIVDELRLALMRGKSNGRRKLGLVFRGEGGRRRFKAEVEKRGETN